MATKAARTASPRALRRALFGLTVSMAALGPAGAQPARSDARDEELASRAAPTATVADEAAATAARAIVRYELQNGLRVVLDVDPSESSVVVCLTLPLGSRHDPEGAEGAAWLWQHVQSSPAAGSERAARLEELEARGGSSRAQAGLDESVVTTQVAPGALELGLRVTADHFDPPTVPATSFVELRTAAALSHERQYASNLDKVGERRLRRLVFQAFDPYERLGSESAQSIHGIAHGTLMLLHERHVDASRSVLTISGLFSESDARAWIRQHFEALPRGSRTDAPPPRDLPRQTSERFNASVNAATRVPLAFYAWSLPMAEERAQSSLRLLAKIFEASPRIGASSAAAAPDIDAVRAWSLTPGTPAALAVRLSVNPRSNVDKARAALERELLRLGTSGPTEVELERARASIVTELNEELDSAVTRAAMLGRYELHEGDATLAFDQPQRYARIDASDVREVIREYLIETRRTSVELYPPGWQIDLPPEVIRRKHLVKAGENLIQIAKRYHSSVDAIAEANKIRTHRFIFPGQELVIPVKTADVERAKRRSYVVKPGDTLIGIAGRHGVSVSALQEASGRRPNQTLRSGETLTIPDAPRASRTEGTGKLRQHRVKRGDSLLGLAKRYGVSAADIAAANGRRPNQPILAGELLSIPPPASAAGARDTARDTRAVPRTNEAKAPARSPAAKGSKKPLQRRRATEQKK